MADSRVLIAGEEVQAEETSSGHLILPILPKSRTVLTAVTLEKSQIQNFQLQFGHCSAMKIQNLMKSANEEVDQEIINNVVGSCDVCS